MSRRIPFVLCAFTPEGSQVSLNEVRALASQHDYVYGRDWLSLGYKANQSNFVKGLNADLHGSPDYRAHLIAVMASRAVDAAG
jgi:hypothetical protein